MNNRLSGPRYFLKNFPIWKRAYTLYLDLVDIFNKKSIPGEARLNLARWYNDVEKFDNREFNKVLGTF